MAGLAAPAAEAATASGSSRATIVRPGSLVNDRPLAFGNVIPGPTGGTVTVSITGVRTFTGGVTLAGGTVSAARFLGLDVQTPMTAQILAPPSSVTLTRVGGGGTMTVTNLQVESGPGFYFVPANAVFQVRVGGRLNVGPNQMTGTYNGTFQITVNYN